MSQQKAQLVNPIGNITVPGGIIVSGATTAGNFIGSFSGTATGLSGTPNLNVGVVTATAFYGNGSALTGVAGSTFVGQSTTSQSPTTTINLSLGNVIYFNHTVDTTVAFANTATTDSVTFIRTKDDSATARAITWPASVRWTGGSAPTLINSSQPNDAQIFNLLTRDSGATWYAHEEVSYTPPIPYELWVWGNGGDGNLAQNDRVPRSSPVQIPGNTWSSISNGNTDYRSIKTDGTLWAWGGNAQGQLGLNNKLPYSSPVQIPGTQWSKIFAANEYTGAIKTDGTLWTWGSNSYGNLGLNDKVHRSSPVQVPGTQWSNFFSGYYGPLATKTDGTLWAWGYNYYGQLGTNDRVPRSSPTQVPGTQWDINKYKVGWIASQSVGAIKSDGTLWSWGSSFAGSLGQNNLTYRSSPVQIPGTQWKYLSNANTTNGGVISTKTDGTLWAWGYNQGAGTLGLNDTVSRSSPAQIPGTQWDLISCNYFALATKTDGTLWSWGGNGAGRSGTNDNVDRSSPTQIPGTQWGGSITASSGAGALKQG